ncbi:MAG TPA: SAM-dependent methyltransferase [Flavobacteriales bacterium]|nr:SAM-dependent methyltransferase [Flavobacteriales bacterium]
MNKTRVLVPTKDGSSTILDPETGDHYHSMHGAEQEARHVFIEMGLKNCLKKKKEIQLLEVGFGTGLNAILSLEHASAQSNVNVIYTGLEPYPLEKSLYNNLFFNVLKHPDLRDIFLGMHQSEFNLKMRLMPSFQFEKKQVKLMDYPTHGKFDLIYYDAFGPSYQPEMWGPEAVEHVCSLMKPNACLVTYCAQGSFRRTLESVGLNVERLKGPPGKREMIRATRR